jgi:hypothetical protein
LSEAVSKNVFQNDFGVRHQNPFDLFPKCHGRKPASIYIAIFGISINPEGLRQEFRTYSPKVSQKTNFFLFDARFRQDFSPAHRYGLIIKITPFHFK